jgi:toxin CcdB
MARYDVYRAGKVLVLDVQASLLDTLATRIAVPLIPAAQAPKPIKGLNPVFEFLDAPHVLLTQALAAVPLNEMRPTGHSLDAHHDEILRALDLLLTGF